MYKYLIINFNSYYFPKDNRTKDYVFNNPFSYSKRADKNLAFKEPITLNHVSNCLHVLFGERPVPSFRKCYYKRNNKIHNIAKNSYIHYKLITTSDKKGLSKPIPEMFSGNKSQYNSWQKDGMLGGIQWAKVKKYVGSELFPEFQEIFERTLNTKVNETKFMDFWCMFKYEHEIPEELYHFLKTNRLTVIIHFLYNPDRALSEFIKKTKDIVNSSPKNKVNIYGKIIVPIDTKETFDKIIKSNATILDSGLARIVKIVDYIEEEEIEDYILVNDINNEII